MSDGSAIEHEPWWEDVVGDLVEILLELGESVCARRTLDFYTAAQRESHWRVGVSVERRCRALLSAVDGDLDGALNLLDSAVAAAEEADAWSQDLGRALVARGGLLRRLGRTWDARSDLKRALAVFTRHGATSWRSAALQALVGTVSAEPNPWTAVEPGRVVTALTGGHWNDREIAARLQLSLLAVQREMGGDSPGYSVLDSLPETQPAG